jgi:hypothetical protein
VVMVRYAFGMTALLLVLLSKVAAEDSTSLEQFLAQYRCPVVDRLQRIYAAGDPVKHPDEYLIIDLPPYPEHYVQCVFYAPRKMLCEAASGYFLNAPDEPRTMHLSASAIAALGRLGFSTDDSKGNFRIDLDVAEPPDFNAIAELMLTALHDAFNAEANTKLRFHAPYARRATSKCTPVS